MRANHRKGRKAAALLLAGMLTAAMIPGNLLAEESLSPGDDSAALESAADLSAAEGNAVTMSDQADEAAGNTAVKTGEGEDQTGENPAQAEVPGGPGEAKEPSETEKADAAEDTDKTGRTDPAEDTVETGEADKTGGSEQTGEQPAGHEDSQTGAEDRQSWQMTDPATGISAEADVSAIPLGTIMWVTPLESGQNYELLSMLLSVTAGQFRIYDIRFFDLTGNAVEPGGAVRISVPIPTGYAADRLAVYHISMDGQRTEQAFTVENGMAVFETDQFSLFAIVEKKENSGAQTDLPSFLEPTQKIPRLELNSTVSGTAGAASGASYGRNAASPETGDSCADLLWAPPAIMASASAAALILLRRRFSDAPTSERSGSQHQELR